MELAELPELREQLERLDDAIANGMQILVDHVQSVDPVQLDVLSATAERLALRLDENLPPAMEPSAVAEIRGILIGALRRLREAEEADEERPLDVLNDFLVRAESIRHVIRDALDEELPMDSKDVSAILKQLREWLPRLSKKQIAELVGVDSRTLLRWDEGKGRVTHRVELVLRLVVVLKEAWTPEGVYAWFFRPRRDLEGQRPVDVINGPAYEQQLLHAVREGRAQHGS